MHVYAQNAGKSSLISAMKGLGGTAGQRECVCVWGGGRGGARCLCFPYVGCTCITLTPMPYAFPMLASCTTLTPMPMYAICMHARMRACACTHTQTHRRYVSLLCPADHWAHHLKCQAHQCMCMHTSHSHTHSRAGEPTIAPLPGTTLGLINVPGLPLGPKQRCFDTPGVPHNHQLTAYLKPEEVKAVCVAIAFRAPTPPLVTAPCWWGCVRHTNIS